MTSVRRYRSASGRLRKDDGMTIAEVMVAMLILLLGVLATVTMIDRANAAGSEAKARDRATSLTRDLVEAARGIPYPDLVQERLEAQLKAAPGLEDANTATAAYEIDRANIRFTVTARVCAVDDAKDGLGPHAPSGYCAGPAGTADTVPDDYRRFSVSLTWKVKGREYTVRQASSINNPGSAFGPAVTGIDPVGTILPIYDDLVSTDFDITTNRSADSVRWAVDGNDVGNAAKKGGSDTKWDVAWFIATLVDGPYLLSAQAYDGSGLSAGPYTKSIVLNRFKSLTPTGLVAGANKAADWTLLNPKYRIDIEWLPNKERDIVGYRVYRALGSTPNTATDPVVCSTGEKTTNCITEYTGTQSLAYYVVALDKDQSGATRAGLPSAPALANLANIPPTAVRNLTATTTGGTVELEWEAPSSAGEPTDTIEFYRIYRDGTGVGDRHARVGTSTPKISYTGEAGHVYRVSAVDSQLGESPLSGAVP